MPLLVALYYTAPNRQYGRSLASLISRVIIGTSTRQYKDIKKVPETQGNSNRDLAACWLLFAACCLRAACSSSSACIAFEI
jgi:hypothetical protein